VVVVAVVEVVVAGPVAVEVVTSVDPSGADEVPGLTDA